MLALAPWHASHSALLRVYRCTGADGAVSLQDAPCAKDAEQELRTLKRPVDAPPPPAPVATVPPSPPPAPEPSMPLAPPTPLYECVTHDDQRYESDTGIGQTRWVPLWVLGLDPRAPASTFGRTGATPSPPRSAPAAPRRAPGVAALGAGTWVQDVCYELPPAEVCARRRKQLADLRRDRKDAQANARVTLRAEADVLVAQLARECP